MCLFSCPAPTLPHQRCANQDTLLYATVMVFIYPLGVPAVYAYVLWVYRKQLWTVQRVQSFLHNGGESQSRRDVAADTSVSKVGCRGETSLDYLLTTYLLTYLPTYLLTYLPSTTYYLLLTTYLQFDEATLDAAPGVVLYIDTLGIASGDEGVKMHIGLYKRRGTWRQRPAFRNTDDPSKWLVYYPDPERPCWLVQATAERGSTAGGLKLDQVLPETTVFIITNSRY